MNAKEKKRIVEELKREQATFQPKKTYTKDEIDIIEMFYGKVPVGVLAKKIGHSPASVRKQYYVLRDSRAN